MSRYEAMFKNLENKKAAFIPFVMLGDPNLAVSKKIILQLINSGADALELGIPFSDPIADGPVIQKATLRALKNHIPIKNIFNLIAEIRSIHQEIPIGILTYANLVYKNNIDFFYETATKSGVDSVLIADLPLLEAKTFVDIALKNHIDPVFIAPTNISEQRIKEIANLGQGYTYVVSRDGVTGASNDLEFKSQHIINLLQKYNAPPAVFGFGIHSAEQVKQAIAQGGKGVIIGSKITSIIEENLYNEDILLKELDIFIKKINQATLNF